jgi:hypothetical protein
MANDLLQKFETLLLAAGYKLVGSDRTQSSSYLSAEKGSDVINIYAADKASAQKKSVSSGFAGEPSVPPGADYAVASWAGVVATKP